MKTETPSAAPSGGSALPGLDAGRREALTHYAAQLLEGAARHAAEVVGSAEARVASAEPATEGAENSGPDEAAARERPVEAYFAAVRRQALARLRQEGLTQRTAATEGDDTAASLSQRVDHLTPKQREVVRLKFSHGFGYESIARITGLSVHHVGFLLHSALTNLRDTAAEADDERVTDYVLGELSDGSREAFEDALHHDRALKETMTSARALAGELRSTLGRGESFAAKKSKRRGGAGWWRRAWPYAAVLLVLAAMVAVWRMLPTAGATTRVAASDTEEFRLRPDSWKLAKARREAEASSAGPGGPGGSRSAPAKIKPPSEPAEPRSAHPADDPTALPLPANGGGLAGENRSAGSGIATSPSSRAAEGDGAGENNLASPSTGTGKGKDGSLSGLASVARGGGGGGSAAAPAPGGRKSKALPAVADEGAAPAVVPAPPRSFRPASSDASPDRSTAKPNVVGRAPPARAPLPEVGIGTTEPSDQKAASVRPAVHDEKIPGIVLPAIPALLAEFAPEPVVPAGAPELSVVTEVAESPWASERRLVRVVVSAAPAPQARAVAAHVVLLIDVSSSMDAPDRLPLVGEAARRLLRELRPDDRVSLVTYAGDARMALPPTPARRGAEIRAALAALAPQGPTNGGAGLRRAYALAREHLVPGGVNRVILCTDGDFNMGVTSEAELRSLVEAEARAGVALGVFGFGRGRQIDPRLEALATAGRGGSGYVNTRAEALQCMAAEVNGWQPAVVRDLRVDFQADPARIASCRLVGYEQNLLPPEAAGRRSLEAGDLAPSASLTALFEVVPVAPQTSGMRQAGLGLTLQIGYADTRGATHIVPLPVRDEGRRFPEASAAFRFTTAVAGFGLALRESPLSRERLTEIVAWAERAAAELTDADPGGYREEFLALAREAREAGK